MESRLDRSERPAQALSDVFQREVRPEAEDDHDSFVRRQRVESSEQRLTFDEGRERIATDWFGPAVDRDETDDVSPTKPVAAAVDEDPVEPGAEHGGLAQRVERLPGNDEGVLNGVLGLVRVGEEKPGQSVGPIEPWARCRKECCPPGISGDHRSVARLGIHR